MTTVVLTCSTCGQSNRVPASRLNGAPKCGKCHAALVSAAPVDVDEATLAGLVHESSLPMLVDFWAPWCGPCRSVAPVLQQVAKKFAGQVLLVKVNTDENQSAGTRHRISGIPTLIAFQGGREQGRLVGAHPGPATRGDE